jgi:hypothetical protein
MTLELQLLARDKHYNSWLGTDITTPGSGQTLQLLARDRHYNSWLGTDIKTPGSGQTQTCYSYLKYTLPSHDKLFLIITYHTYNTRVYLKRNI